MVRVASYCRVSTDSADQANSFASQQNYFKAYIQSRPNWELYQVYADEGITGTSTKKRTQFNKMMNDAYSGKFEIILTKEVSRFSRNLLDTIAYTRELKALGIGVIFMNDGFSSLDPDAELRLSIMGSIAQEESRKTSSRVKWGQSRQMEKGIVFGASMLGYEVRDGKLSINPEGAEIVRLIFQKYTVEKKGTSTIARELREAGIKTLYGSTMWKDTSIVRILRNEKYVGDLIQKKSFTPDYLTHEKKRNTGQEALITIRNHHEPIIDRNLWNDAQEELSRRHRTNPGSAGHSTRYVFSGKIVCAECGAGFVSRRKTRKSGSSYRRWGCYTASSVGRKRTDPQGNSIGCDVGKQIRDDLALETLIEVVKRIPVDFDWIIQNLTGIVLSAIQAGEDPQDNPDRLNKQIEQLQTKQDRATDAFLSGILSQEAFQRMRLRYDEKLESLHSALKACNSTKKPTSSQLQADVRGQIKDIITCKKVSEPFLRALLHTLVVHKDGTLAYQIAHLPQTWVYQLEYHKGNPEKEYLQGAETKE